MFDLSRQEHIFIYHNGQQYGPMNYAKACEFVGQNPPTPNDLYWAEGMSTWAPLPDDFLSSAALSTLGDPPTGPTQTTPVPASQPLSGLKLESVAAQELPNAKAIQPQPVTPRTPVQNLTPVTTPTSAVPRPDVTKKAAKTAAPTFPTRDESYQQVPPGKTGLGGWMIPVVVTSLLVLGFSLYTFYLFTMVFIGTTSNPAMQQASTQGNVQLLTLLASFGSFVACAWAIGLNLSLFRKRKSFPSMFRATIGVLALFGIFIFGFILLERMNVTHFFRSTLPSLVAWLPEKVNLFGQWVDSPLVALGGALVLILFLMYLTVYVGRSKRVQQTFLG